MRRLSLLASCLLSALIITSFVGGACKSAKSDEDLITELVDRAIDGANEKKVGTVVEDATETFRGPNKADLRECRRILAGFFLQQGWIKVFKRSLTIQTEGEFATADLEVVLAKGNPVESLEDLVPTNSTALLFHLKLQKIAGDWKITEATYERKRFG